MLSPDGTLLTLQLGGPHAVLSWAIVNGGRRVANAVVWHHVDGRDLPPEVDPPSLLTAALKRAGFPDAVGLLTGCDLSQYVDRTCTDGPWNVRCMTTLGMSNAVSVGDPPGPLLARVGTINTVCRLSHSLSEEALVEAVAIATEARTAAVMEGAILSRRSERLATGTGTDCIVIAAPLAGPRESFVGKHTALGAVLGAVVREATTEALMKRHTAPERR